MSRFSAYLWVAHTSFSQRFVYRADSLLSIVYDGRISAFMDQFVGEHMITVDFADESADVSDPRLKVQKSEGPRKVILFHRRDISPGEAVTLLTRSGAVNDISIKEPNIEDIVRGIYKQRAGGGP